MASREAESVNRLNNELRDAWLADPNYGFDDLRRIFEDWLGQFAIPSDARISPCDANGVPGLWVDAPGARTDRVVIHFHSGGYLLGSAHSYRSFGAFLSAATGCRVLLPDYRLAPEHPYPAAVEDALTVYRWVLAQGMAPESTVICGDSAGGGLALAALQAIRDAGLPNPACGVAISPLADFARSGASHVDNIPVDPLCTPDFLATLGSIYCGGRDPKDPGLSPLYGNWRGLSPLLILAGEIEMMRDDGKLCAEAAARAGCDATYVEGKDMAHIWTLYADRLPEAREALAGIGAFVSRHLKAD